MSDPGLTYRLRQRSRRAGLMIGISMVLTIALCAVGFTVIYTALEGFTSDFVSQTEVVPTEPEIIAESDPDDASAPPAESLAQTQDNTDGDQNDAGPEESESNPVIVEGDDPEPTPIVVEGDESDESDEGDFDPDYQLQGVTVNLRSGPSTSTSIVTALPPSTPLEYLNEDAPTDSPADGDRWMMFETEDGLEGWIREIDVTDYEA